MATHFLCKCEGSCDWCQLSKQIRENEKVRYNDLTPGYKAFVDNMIEILYRGNYTETMMKNTVSNALEAAEKSGFIVRNV